MSAITTHVLDLGTGRPAHGMPVTLEIHRPDRGWVKLTEKTTDADGRARELLAAGAALDAGHYRLTFDTTEYFRSDGGVPFFPEVQITFEVRDPNQHYHVPLLLSPFGYSTYRGS
ncbi:MAG TPA: hydroxyisourate hydrolase [Candidatus Eisenbacteria bacterium]|nr:hydroxyisourate hydrolase [Candidatus Eisenbacteria bacterium]